MNRFSSFFSKTLVNKRAAGTFIKHYARGDNWHNFSTCKGDLGYGWIHYAYIRLLKPRRVLCIGSRHGYIPAVCALACKDNGKGMVDFVDAGLDEDRDEAGHWGGQGVWKRVNSNEYFKPFQLESYIQLHVMRSFDFFKKYPKRTFTYIHIDGDHSFKGVEKDFLESWKRLKSGGIIALHDIYAKPTKQFTYGVSRLWNSLIASKKYQTFSLPGTYGLGLVQKPYTGQ
jgi:predicted O-methyltransferase YrrM